MKPPRVARQVLIAVFTFSTTLTLYNFYNKDYKQNLDQYNLPTSNKVVIEPKFVNLDSASKQYEPILVKLDLIDPKIVVNDVSEVNIDDIAIVNAASKDHFSEALRILCPSLMHYKKRTGLKSHLYFYVLEQNLTDIEEQNFLDTCPIIIIRYFPFHMFPEHIKYPSNYGFKPLTVALMLLEFKVVYWLDTSTTFRNTTDGLTMEAYLNTMIARNMSFAQCNFAHHSIYATTNPKMFEYLPLDSTTQKTVMMIEAGHLLFIGTKTIKTTVLQKLIRCALVNDCIAPSKSRQLCSFRGDRWTRYANCHRYDQSATAIIAQTYFGYNAANYVIPCEQWATA